MCTHSNDGGGTTDPRLVHIPAQDHAPSSMRPIFFPPESYPRYVGSERGGVPAYAPNGHQSAFESIGHIPQVAHTFSYMEETYGAMNEHQVAVGESTCSGVFGTSAAGHGGKALMSVDTLSQLAMERANTSRSAVKIMGALAEQFGFYGEGTFEGSAESLMVTDKTEGFIFHILPDESGESAIWVAQRVPDTDVGVVANAFVIREVNFSDSFNFLGSTSVHETAQRKGWWDPADGLLDFTQIYSDGEYAHKYYSGRRVWGAYLLMAPSLQLSPTYDEWRKSKPYPVTLAPDEKISVAALMHVMRSYYEGTPYDLTKGLAAGPFATPDHVAGGSATGEVKGNWERSIGLFRTSDSHVAQSRAWLPDSVGGILWWGPHAAPYTMYVPFAAGMTSLPDVTLGTPAALERTSLYWGVRYLFNYAQLRRNAMIEHINELQAAAHNTSLSLQARLDRSGTITAAELTAVYSANAISVRDEIFSLADSLFFRYSDGYINEVGSDGVLASKGGSYPDEWLRAVNYTNGPPPI
uniref:Dipeptidase n=1 Tax=Coccolithus braarudii TaxID=221442 RepID=A0A7S0L7U0_9EUKA